MFTWWRLSAEAGDRDSPAAGGSVIMSSDTSVVEQRLHSKHCSSVVCLLQSYARMDKDHVGRKAPAASPADSSKQSVEAKLAAEVAELKDKRKARFKRHETNVRGTAFVELPKGDGE